MRAHSKRAVTRRMKVRRGLLGAKGAPVAKKEATKDDAVELQAKRKRRAKNKKARKDRKR